MFGVEAKLAILEQLTRHPPEVRPQTQHLCNY